MEIIRVIFIIFCLFTSLFAKDEKVYKYGFVYDYSILADYKDARNSLKNWVETFAKNNDINLEVLFYEESSKAYEDFKNKKLSLVIVSNDFFYENEKEINEIANNFWTISFSENKNSRYCIIKRNDIKFNDFKDLYGKRVSIKNKNSIAYSYLDNESLISNKKPFENVVSKINLESKESTLVLNVFFNKSDLAIVTENAWQTMQELNPGIRKYVSLYGCSDTKFTAFIGLFSKDTPIEHINTFFNITNDLKKFEDTKELFLLFDINEIRHLSDLEIKKMREFYNSYKTLKEKYR